MRNDPNLIDLLCCLNCGKKLQLTEISEIAPDDHIMAGVLQCTKCDKSYQISQGIPRFVPMSLKAEASETVDGFGYQWQEFNPIVHNKKVNSSEVFLDFIEPVKPGHFAGKVVLDAGCGLGRFTHWAQQFGASHVVGVDLSKSVDAAFANTRHLSNVLIIQADLFLLPLRRCFDYVFCVGVLHHTSDPCGAFKAIAGLVKEGGELSVWVYGKEGNEWIVNILNPIRRKITSRLPRNFLKALTYIVTVPMFLILKGIYVPVGRSKRFALLRRYLFYYNYLYYMSQFGFHEQRLIVFDHLVPTISEYVSKEELIEWYRECNLQLSTVTSRNGNSWRGFGFKSSAQANHSL
jgi:SAM-dependent methyltransferase